MTWLIPLCITACCFGLMLGYGRVREWDFLGGAIQFGGVIVTIIAWLVWALTVYLGGHNA